MFVQILYIWQEDVKTYWKLRFDNVLHLDVQVLDFDLHAFPSLHCCRVCELRLLQLREKSTHFFKPVFWICFTMPSYKRHKERTASKRVAYLIFQLDNLPLARCIALQVVQHNLSISQKDFGPLQIFLQPLLRLHIPLANLNDAPASLVLFQGLWHMWSQKSKRWSALSGTHSNSMHVCMQTCAQVFIQREHRAAVQPCPGCSAVCTPALFSRAALSACLHTPPPAAPPSVSAAGHVQRVRECDQLRGESDKPHHKPSRFPIFTAVAEYSILQNTHYKI